jgi:hypothetical protein
VRACSASTPIRAAGSVPGVLVLFIALLTFPPPLAAVDFGFMLDQSAAWDDTFSGDIDRVSYTGILNPWISGMLIENGDLYLSASISPRVENGNFFIIPELLRSEVIINSDYGMSVRFGRMFYTDPLGFIARGTFDGMEISQSIGNSTLNIGGWYTGLQYKKSANITVSPLDSRKYYADFDSENMDTYFSPRRMLAALSWEHPALAEKIRFQVAALGQFDLNNEDDKYHSEYLALKAIIPYRSLVFFDAGAALELLQTPDDEHILGMAAELGAAWMPPGGFQDQLSLMARYSSGHVKDSPVASFLPLSTATQGSVLKEKLSGLAHFRLGYTSRLHRTFTMNLSTSYFMRTSKVAAVAGGMDPEEDHYALGGEGYMSLIWSPVSDFRMNFGGGVFLPQLGDIVPTDRPRWLFEIGASTALY